MKPEEGIAIGVVIASTLVYLSTLKGSKMSKAKYEKPGSVKTVEGIDFASDLPIEELLAEVRDMGGVLRPSSGLRSIEVQTVLFARAVKRYGSEKVARKWVAPPGNSEHQSGYAADFLIEDIATDSRNVVAIMDTKTYRILDSVANRLGWKPYEPEPWHWSRLPQKES